MAVPHLKNKQVLITGAGSGIGRATALAFARRGANIVASDINPDALDAVKHDIEALGVSCLDARRRCVRRVGDEGVRRRWCTPRSARSMSWSTMPASPILAGSWTAISTIGRGCSTSTSWAWCMAAAISFPPMVAAGGARQVLNVASGAGNYPTPSLAAYCASKYAVTGFSEVLKMELADSTVGVTTVFPGVINTAIISGSGVSPSVPAAQVEKLEAYYRAKGCAPEVVAEDMVRAAQKGTDICLTGPSAKLIYHIKRVSQKLMRRLMTSSAKKVGYLYPTVPFRRPGAEHHGRRVDSCPRYGETRR